MKSNTKQKTWFVTGASRGFGRIWSEAALERGDKVVACARNVEALSDLAHLYPDTILPLTLDVTDRKASSEAVAKAHEHYGRIDVVVCNAGYGLFGAIEEIAEEEARRQVETNFFGVLWVLQAVAPFLREQRSGHVLLTSSFGGLVGFPTAGLYGATKFALEGMGEAFALEMRGFGANITLIEPAAYATDFGGPSAAQASPLSAYDSARAETGAAFELMPPGDPQNTASAILQLVDLEEPPLRLMLGEYALPFVRDAYKRKMDEWQEWSAVASGAQ